MRHLLLRCRDLSLATKIRTVECSVFSVLMYGMEAWTLIRVIERKIEAFEMWIYPRLLKISWVDHVINDKVLRRVGKNRELLLIIKKRKLEHFGHVMRHPEKYKILHLAMQGKIYGKRGPGRRRISWLRNLRDWFGLSSLELFRRVVNKASIAMMIANCLERVWHVKKKNRKSKNFGKNYPLINWKFEK